MRNEKRQPHTFPVRTWSNPAFQRNVIQSCIVKSLIINALSRNSNVETNMSYVDTVLMKVYGDSHARTDNGILDATSDYVQCSLSCYKLRTEWFCVVKLKKRPLFTAPCFINLNIILTILVKLKKKCY